MRSTPKAIFSFPTPTIVGPGTLAGLPCELARLGVEKPLVVTDPGLTRTGAYARLIEVLESGSDGHAVFSGVHPNPREADLAAAHSAFLESGCDGVIAFGGGSALDVGKAVRLLIARPDIRIDSFSHDCDPGELAPCVCVPTTAGTGSEVGRSSVITLDSTGRKSVLFHPKILADLVILDAELTRDLPAGLTAATGVDALTHCIEAFTAPAYHPYCDGIALEGIHLVAGALPNAVKNGHDDLDARTDMLVAAAMGAIAFQKDLGATHSMAHPLSTVCGVHHGLANALCLPAVMRFNTTRKPGLYRRVGIACGLDVMADPDERADVRTIEFIEKFIAGLGIQFGLRHHGVAADHIDTLVTEAVADPCHPTNPVPVTEDDFRELYQTAFDEPS